MKLVITLTGHYTTSVLKYKNLDQIEHVIDYKSGHGAYPDSYNYEISHPILVFFIFWNEWSSKKPTVFTRFYRPENLKYSHQKLHVAKFILTAIFHCYLLLHIAL